VKRREFITLLGGTVSNSRSQELLPTR